MSYNNPPIGPPQASQQGPLNPGQPNFNQGPPGYPPPMFYPMPMQPQQPSFFSRFGSAILITLGTTLFGLSLLLNFWLLVAVAARSNTGSSQFGSTQEVGLFEMTGSGLLQVTDPGQLFVRPYGSEGPPSGSVLTCAMQGSRCLLLETQALTSNSVIGSARRKVSGVSGDRVAMIIAVLEKRCDLRLADQDVYVNVAGGVKVAEPGIDLAIAMAIASAHMNRPLPPGTMAVGELGLGGEVRSVAQLEQRLREASRLGVSHAVIPHAAGPIPALGGLALHSVRRLNQALADL